MCPPPGAARSLRCPPRPGDGGQSLDEPGSAAEPLDGLNTVARNSSMLATIMSTRSLARAPISLTSRRISLMPTPIVSRRRSVRCCASTTSSTLFARPEPMSCTRPPINALSWFCMYASSKTMICSTVCCCVAKAVGAAVGMPSSGCSSSLPELGIGCCAAPSSGWTLQRGPLSCAPRLSSSSPRGERDWRRSDGFACADPPPRW